ncbi:unnamed protein product, partial [Symbiodinium sp. CCMP2456]
MLLQDEGFHEASFADVSHVSVLLHCYIAPSTTDAASTATTHEDDRDSRFGIPAPVAYFTPHNSFSTCDILTEVPADPCMNSLHFHGQLTCENVRLHSHGWDVFTPCANLTWETTHDSRQ